MLFRCSWFKYRFIKLDLVTVGKFAFISSVVDCVSVNPSARLNNVLRDAQKVCALTIVGTVLNIGLSLGINYKAGLKQSFYDVCGNPRALIG